MSNPGRRIARARNLRGLSQHHLAEATGVSISTIGRIESGKARKSAAIPVLENYLHITPDDEPGTTDQDNGEPRYTLLEARRRLSAWDLLAELAERLGADAVGSGTPLPQESWELGSEHAPSRRHNPPNDLSGSGQ